MISPEEKFWNSQKVVRAFAKLSPPPYWEEFFSTLPHPLQWRILDLGCGSGRVTLMAIQKGLDVWACDKSKNMAATTRRRLSRLWGAGTAKKRVLQADMTKLPFPDGQFDCVVANGIYHNAKSVSEMESAIKETSRVLRRGGFLCLNVFYAGFMADDLQKDKTAPHRFFTNEGLSVILLPKELLLRLLHSQDFSATDKITYYESGVLTGKRSVMRGIFYKADKTRSKTSVFRGHTKLERKIIDGVSYFHATSVRSEKNNPFVRKTYDFDAGFYRGKFSFKDPVTGREIRNTVENYGRRRIIARMLNLSMSFDSTVLDLGAGTLNIAREFLSTKTGAAPRFVNCDISGPWSSREISVLELGSHRFATREPYHLNSITNVEFDMNSGSWIFGDDCFECITACMIIHHVRPKFRQNLLRNIHRSLRAGGRLMVMDVFAKSLGGLWLTDAGKRGPAECGGYPTTFTDFLSLALKAGFKLDPMSRLLSKEKRTFLSKHELKETLSDLRLPLPINKATWYAELRK